jgi:hypothetical protein
MDSITEGVIAKIKQRAERFELSQLNALELLERAQTDALAQLVYLEQLIRLNGPCLWGRVNAACGEPRVECHDEDRSFTFCPFCGRKIEEAK